VARGAVGAAAGGLAEVSADVGGSRLKIATIRATAARVTTPPAANRGRRRAAGLRGAGRGGGTKVSRMTRSGFGCGAGSGVTTGGGPGGGSMIAGAGCTGMSVGAARAAGVGAAARGSGRG
jgi:hypothetical protein